jgi:hypothetical protein
VKKPFELKKLGATYQWCMQPCFKQHIGRNLEVYIDDIVVKTRQGDSLIYDLEETFINLRRFNIRLNPEKCTFGVPMANSRGTSSPSAALNQILTKCWLSLK